MKKRNTVLFWDVCALRALCRSAFPVLLVLTLAFAQRAEARGIGGGRGRQAQDLDQPTQVMRWFENLDAALTAANNTDPALPVVGFLRMVGGPTDKRITSVLFGNATIIAKSHTSFAAFALDLATEEGKQAVQQWGVRIDGALIWFDSHGNYIHKEETNFVSSGFLNKLKYWQSALDIYKRVVERRIREAKKLLERGKHATALKTLASIFDIKGPKANEVRKLLGEIETLGNRLLDRVDQVNNGSAGRRLLLQAIATEFRGSSVEARSHKMIQEGYKPKSQTTSLRPASAEAITATTMQAERARWLQIHSTEFDADESATLQTHEPSIKGILSETKRPLAESADTSSASTAGLSSSRPERKPLGVDVDDLNALVKAARERLGKGKAIYSEAAKSEEGKSYAQAFDILTEACDLAALALKKKPGNRAITRLIEDISFLRYACFKHLPDSRLVRPRRMLKQ